MASRRRVQEGQGSQRHRLRTGRPGPGRNRRGLARCSPFRLDRAERTLRVGEVRARAAARRARRRTTRGCVGTTAGSMPSARTRGAARSRTTSRRGITSTGCGWSRTASPGTRSRMRWARCSAPTRCLAAHYHRALDQVERGIDVEGIAVREDTMLLGLRSPCLDGQAFLLEVAVADLFEHDPRPHTPGCERHAWPWVRLSAFAIWPGAGWRAGAERAVGGRRHGAVRPMALGMRPASNDGALRDLGDAKAEGLMVLSALGRQVRGSGRCSTG